MKSFMITCALIVALVATSCTSTTDPTPTDTAPNQQLIVEGTTGDYSVKLYADKPLTTGYNELTAQVQKKGAAFRNVSMIVRCEVDTYGLVFDAPFEQAIDVPDETGTLKCALIFHMSSDVGWTVVVSLHDNESSADVEIRLPVKVAEANNTQTVPSVKMGDMVFVLNKSTWSVGMNECDLLVYVQKSGEDFKPMPDAQLTVNPTMPSMGHGSNGNVDPVHVTGANYRTTVNLIMSGEWNIEFSFSDGIARRFIHFPIMVP